MNPVDSLWGVKEKKGKIIIPAQYKVYTAIEDGEKITDSIIIFNSSSTFIPSEINPTSLIWGDAYDRCGNFLYHPMFFDNGPDYFNEGLARCVENGKAGFVNIKGDVVIQPKWDWVSGFNYGYATTCNDCYWDRKKDPEHPPLVFNNKDEVRYINTKGEIVIALEKPTSDKDQLLDNGKYLPYPFVYTPAEQKLVDKFNRLEILSKIYFMNYYNDNLTEKESKLQFEITGRPTKAWPYYTVQGYSYTELNGYYGEDEMIFLVKPDSTTYHFSYFGNIVTPFKKWQSKELKDCIEFFKKHPDAPNKFDVKKFMRSLLK